jgi:tRNA(fMet)-specific endonuclease VapC
LAYRELGDLFRFFAAFEIIPFNHSAVDHFEHLIPSKVRIGTMDLTIAAIALAHDA